MQNLKQYFFLFILIPFLLTHCGGTSEPVTTEEDPSESDVVNTEKLVGTPFEGLETGDDLEWDFFVCGNYRTETIDELPIKIFAAFFTESEEEVVQEGIDIANTAMGPTNDGGVFFELTDVWSDDVRVIYKVENISSESVDLYATGHCMSVDYYFSGGIYAERQTADWRIELISSGVNKWVVAHELGHAVGISGHWLINYEENSVEALEENSLMSAYLSLSSDPALDDYNYMLEMQGQIMIDHLGEKGAIFGSELCDLNW